MDRKVRRRGSSPSPARLRAWVDESGSVHAFGPDTYLLAAAVGAMALEDETRKAMQGLRLPGQRKLHWRDEGARRQRAITTAISVLGCLRLAVVRAGAASDPLKRRRNKCLERLLPDLEALGVVEATFESQGPADDHCDLELVQALRGRRVIDASLLIVIDASLLIQHATGPKESMLWVPDAVWSCH